MDFCSVRHLKASKYMNSFSTFQRFNRPVEAGLRTLFIICEGQEKYNAALPGVRRKLDKLRGGGGRLRKFWASRSSEMAFLESSSPLYLGPFIN